jgi:hypothetical protein
MLSLGLEFVPPKLRRSHEAPMRRLSAKSKEYQKKWMMKFGVFV